MSFCGYLLDCPHTSPCFLHLPHTPTHKNHPSCGYWCICPSVEPIAYWVLKVPVGKEGSCCLVSVSDPHNRSSSQWIPLPSHSFPCQAGKSKYLSVPHNNGQFGEERDFDQSSCKIVWQGCCQQRAKDRLQEY